jgi:hypothetical protein
MERWLDPSGKDVLTEEFDPPPPGLSQSRVVFLLTPGRVKTPAYQKSSGRVES